MRTINECKETIAIKYELLAALGINHKFSLAELQAIMDDPLFWDKPCRNLTNVEASAQFLLFA